MQETGQLDGEFTLQMTYAEGIEPPGEPIPRQAQDAADIVSKDGLCKKCAIHEAGAIIQLVVLCLELALVKL